MTKYEYAVIVNRRGIQKLLYPDGTEHKIHEIGGLLKVLNSLGSAGWRVAVAGAIYTEDPCCGAHGHDLYLERVIG